VTEETRLWDHASEAPDNWNAAQDTLVVQTIQIGAERSGEIRARLAEAVVSTEDIRTVTDLAPIRVLSKDELPDLQASNPPFGGMLGVEPSELRRIYRSPGPIADPEGRGPDFWRMAPALWAAGFRPGALVLNTFAYHLSPGGHMFDAGLQEVGCVVLPGGVGNRSTQVDFAVSAGATGYVGTPQFLLALLEKVREQGVESPFERALVTGAPLPPDLRTTLEDGFGVRVLEVYGTADAGALGYECGVGRGWHVAPGIVVEIVEPVSGAQCAPGEAGQVVVTSPNPVYPLLRFGTGDLSALDQATCGCGRTSSRLMGFLGRVGEGVKVRGMFVHPRQLADVLGAREDIARYQGIVTADEHRDQLTISVEVAEGFDPDLAALEALLIEAIGVRVTLGGVVRGTIPVDAGPLVDAR